MRRFKGLAILMAIAMLTMLFAGIAFASTTNTVSKIQNIDVDTDNDTELELSSLSISEPEDEPDTFEAGTSFTITLSDGVQFLEPDEDLENTFVKVSTETDGNWEVQDDAADYVTVTRSGDQTLDIEFTNDEDIHAVREKLAVILAVSVDDPNEGDITAEIDDLGTAVSGTSHVVARFVDSNCTVTVSDKDSVSEDGGELARIKISENSVFAIGESGVDLAFKATLPSDFSWMDDEMEDYDLYEFTGGLSGSEVVNVVADGSDLYVVFNIPEDQDRTQRGAVEFDTYVDPENKADMGDIEVTVDGEKKVDGESYEEADVDSTDVIIGSYSDYDVKAYADDSLEDLIAGQEDQDLTTLKIDEGIAASLLSSRKIQVDFPTYVRITDVDVKGGGNLVSEDGEIDTDEDCSSWYVTTDELSDDAEDIEIDFTVSIAADAPAGDLNAKISGSAGAEGEVVLGTIAKPITVEATMKDISLGDKEQAIGDIVIKENVKEAILDDDLVISLPEGVKWATEPKVEVTEGNLSIDDVDVDDGDYTDDVLTISIDSKSSKPSTITISDIQLTVDRTVPFGNIVAKFKGLALAENYISDLDDYDDNDINEDDDIDADDARLAGKFDTSTAAKAAIANLTTPPVDNSGIFYIGSTVYSENGSMKVMDAAPYIKSDRTYVPVRYLAYMLGVTEENVSYDEATKTVTIKKDDKEVQLVIGSTSIMVNGEAKTMDVAPEITNDRTFLPARYVAEGLGYSVGWNPTTQSVIISK